MGGVSGLFGRREVLRGFVALTGLAAGSGARLLQQRLLAARQSANLSVPVVVSEQTVSTVAPVTGWAFPGLLSSGSLKNLPRPGVDASLDAVQSWASSNHGAPLWYNVTELVIRSGAQAAVLADVRVNLARREPLRGTLLWVPPTLAAAAHISYPSTLPKSSSNVILTGAISSVPLAIDLDAAISYAETTGTGQWPDKGDLFPVPTSPFFETHTISLAPYEDFALLIVAGTAKYFCNYSLLFHFVVGGNQVTISVDDSGAPFQLTAGAGRWIDRNHPDYSAYQALYVDSGSPARDWIQQNPQHYSPVR